MKQSNTFLFTNVRRRFRRHQNKASQKCDCLCDITTTHQLFLSLINDSQ